MLAGLSDRAKAMEMKDQVGTYDLIVKDDPRESLEGPWTDLTMT